MRSAVSSGQPGSPTATSRRSRCCRTIACWPARAAARPPERRARMNLHSLLLARAAAGKPLRVGLIGAGKFGSMFLAQARRTAGLHLLGVADLDPARARAALGRVGWPAEQIAARQLSDAVERGTTWVGDDAT